MAAAQALPFLNAATHRPATKEEIGAAFHAVAAMPGSLPASRYKLKISIELGEDKAKELAVSRLQSEFIPKLKRYLRDFDHYPLPAREALIDMAYNAGVGRPETVVHGKTLRATGLQAFRRLKVAIDAGDWAAAARSCHRSSSRPERNEWTVNLFRQAERITTRVNGPGGSLHLLGTRLSLSLR